MKNSLNGFFVLEALVVVATIATFGLIIYMEVTK